MSFEQTLNLIKQIDDSFRELSGEDLYRPPTIHNPYQWLHEDAPYSILVHNTATDPHFIYANKYALSCFKYTPTEMLSLPSRLSAKELDRSERELLLQSVTRDGIAYNYTGLRVDKYGNSFTIYDGVVWQLRNDKGETWGQGALFWTTKHERPEWYPKKNKSSPL